MSRQTAADTVSRIVGGTSGWVALGDFLDDWARSSTAERLRMIGDVPIWPEGDARRWASLVAAAVDALASGSEPRMAVPDWVRSRRTILPEPWFLMPGSAIRMHLLVDTPAPFSARNIFGGDRILSRV
jgi:hypothetical protein